MAKEDRDDFTLETKRIIASKVGYRCSMPNYRKLTASPDYKNNNSLNLGIAAHITAASKGGPRYDSNLTPEQRKDESNGIWLCKDCAYIVDQDHDAYSKQTLLGFKQWAEKKAKSESRVKEDGIKAITDELDNLINKLNFFIDEYESNDPSIIYWKEHIGGHQAKPTDNDYIEYNRLRREYSSQMLSKYEKTTLILLVKVLSKCRILLGDSDDNVKNAYEKLDNKDISLQGLKEIRRVLYELKADIEWR